MSCGRKLGKALVHSKTEPPICDRCDDLERQLAEAQRLLRAASGWMPESNVPPAWNEPILRWREDVARILKEEK